MARKLIVEVVGDASSLDRAFRSASSSTDNFNRRLRSAGKYAGIAGAAIGGALVVGLTKAAKGAIEDESAMARLTQAFKQSNVPIQGYQKAIEEAEAAGVKLGFTDDSVVESLGSLVIATHDGEKAINLLSVAEDIARFKHIDLAAASKVLTMAMAGSQRATKQLGLSLQPTTENVDALKKAAEDNKTKVDSMALAQAKAADKMQTSQAVIALVTQKLKGQSEAFSETSAGGIARMNASLDQLSDTIGAALLPALNKVIPPISRFFTFLAANPKLAEGLVIGIAALAAALIGLSIAASAAASIGVLAAVFAAISLPIAAVVAALVLLTAALVAAVVWPDKLQVALQRMGLSAKTSKEIVDDLRNSFTAIKAVVQTVWPVIQAIIVPALQVIKGLLMIVSGILRGDFSEAWKGVKIVVVNELKFMLAAVLAMPRLVLQAALAIGKAILEGIAQGLQNLGQWVRTKLQELPKALAAVAAQVPGWAAEIGAAITRGILSGMSGLFSAVKDKIIGGVKGAIDGAMGIFGHSPQEVIGIALIDGIIRGWNSASSKLKPALVDKVNSAIDAAQAAVVAKQGVFAQAFESLLSNALAAFDKASDEFQTRTEKKIAAQDAARAKADRARALADAKEQLANAQQAASQIGGTPNEFGIIQVDPAAAAKAIADIQAAQQAVTDAQQAIQRAADEKRAAAERKQYEDSRERQRVSLQNQLAALEQNYLNQQISTTQFHTRLIAIFKAFEVPLGKAANKLGASLAQGLNQSFADVHKAARALANEVLDAFKDIKVVVHVTLEGTAPEHRQHGGPVRAGSSYIVGEAGPELFVPSSAGSINTAGATARMATGGGGGNITFQFYGTTVGTSREFEDTVRRALYDVSRRNPGIGLAT